MAAALIALLAASSAATAQEDQVDVDKLLKALDKENRKIETQENALAEQEKKLAKEHEAVNALRARIETVLNKSGKGTHTAQSEGSSQPGKNKSGSDNGNAIPEEIGTDYKPATPEKPPEVAKYIEEGGVLLPRGKLLVTPGLEYDNLSATNVAIEGFSIIPALNIGVFNVSHVNQDMLMASVDGRLGITNRFEIEGKIPYVYGAQSTVGRTVGGGSSQDTTTNINGYGLGDIEVGAHYQINKGENDWPYFIANLRFKTTTGEGPFEVPVNSFGLESRLPTGSGFYALQPSVTVIYPSDPVVFYGNLGYVHNFERTFATYGTIDPGDSIGASFGMSTSLNDATSLSVGYTHDMAFNATQNGQYLPGERYLQVGTLDFGWAYILNDRVSLNLNISAGITSDAPDDRVVFRVPVSFDAF